MGRTLYESLGQSPPLSAAPGETRYTAMRETIDVDFDVSASELCGNVDGSHYGVETELTHAKETLDNDREDDFLARGIANPDGESGLCQLLGPRRTVSAAETVSTKASETIDNDVELSALQPARSHYLTEAANLYRRLASRSNGGRGWETGYTFEGETIDEAKEPEPRLATLGGHCSP